MVIFKKMAVNNDFELPAPDAVWRLVALYATTDGVRLVFYGYANKAAYDGNAMPIPGAVKEYNLPSGTISAYPDLETGINMAAWAVASMTEDIVDEEATATAKEADPNAPEVHKSFFKDAVDVQ